jgi:hypothetical protein
MARPRASARSAARAVAESPSARPLEARPVRAALAVRAAPAVPAAAAVRAAR